MEIVLLKSINEIYNGINIKEQLIELTQYGVSTGASIGFIHPLERTRAEELWNKVEEEIKDNCKVCFIAIIDDKVVGHFSFGWSLFYNDNSHRVDIQKFLVNPDYRGKGIGKELYYKAEEWAIKNQFKLITTETKTNDVAPHMYRKFGFIEAGTIPGFAIDSFGTHSISYFYKILDNNFLVNNK